MSIAPSFTDFDIDTFLRDYWQKKPLLIPNPWKAWSNPLEPDELAGLACEAEVESRLIAQAPDTWRVEQGPLPEDRFTSLGREPWTLLVQAVDHHVREVAAMIEPFRFIPNWRIDDVMVSYASNGGGVGAHFDHYDVFLVQGLGRRRWQVGQRCDDSTALLPHDDLRLLASFEPTDEWILEPGDMLYVPPGVSHNGVAVGDDCMTYSVGFRAPSRAELIGHWADDLLAEMVDDDRYADPNLKAQANPGEIAPEAIAALHTMVTEKLSDQAAFARWFGEYISAPKYPEVDWQPDEAIDAEALHEALAGGAAIIRNPASRFAFIRRGRQGATLFVNGDSYACPLDFAESLCAAGPGPVRLTDEAAALAVMLFNQGSIAFE